ncbi:cytochrome P450 [Aspergillus piperis CBS 112811]|uniref:Cytochrome P450 n=1 Tax=Aspergillus piperis CBS 112811 TaxID=1448313 RepID=A0A8G1VRW2_9EURO|nr:cytochrome P450 [Aspergillus piperis CBS 112811]RAH63499.1 cytochrome P450 [Aspergillus piperis CBS 112811]
MAVVEIVSDSSNYLLLIVAFFIYFSWHAVKFWNNKHLDNREPPPIPYWVPGIGHTLSFLSDADKMIDHALAYLKTKRSPFKLHVGGKSLYVVQDVPLISDVHKRVKELSNDIFIELLLTAAGVSDSTRTRLWSSISPEIKDSILRALTNNFQTALRAHYRRNSITLGLLSQIQLAPSSLPLYHPLRISIDGPAEVSLHNWVVDALVTITTDSLFGKVCIARFPQLKDNLYLLHMNIPDIFSSRPRRIFPKAYAATDNLVRDFEEYFDLPKEERMDRAEIVTMIEDKLSSAGLSNKELAMLFIWAFWGMLGNSSTTVFWLLCHTLYDPTLFSAVRAECDRAFPETSDMPPHEIPARLESCPTLKAAFQETLRLYAGMSIFRHVYEDTEIGPYHLRKGSNLMIPYNRLHVDKSYWGPDAEEFKYRRFLDNPELANSRYFRPFGEGTHQCGGRMVTPIMAMYFVATVVCRYDVAIVGGVEKYPLPRVETARRMATVTTKVPVAGDVPRITISPRVKV